VSDICVVEWCLVGGERLLTRGQYDDDRTEAWRREAADVHLCAC